MKNTKKDVRIAEVLINAALNGHYLDEKDKALLIDFAMAGFEEHAKKVYGKKPAFGEKSAKELVDKLADFLWSKSESGKVILMDQRNG